MGGGGRCSGGINALTIKRFVEKLNSFNTIDLDPCDLFPIQSLSSAHVVQGKKSNQVNRCLFKDLSKLLDS